MLIPTGDAPLELLLANLKATPFDFVVRQKVQVQTLNWLIVEQLAHEDASAVRKADNRTQYWDQRVRMMQWWADKVDSLEKSEAPL